MAADLFVMATGATVSLGMLGAGMRSASRDVRLHRRVASLAATGMGPLLDAVEDDKPSWRWLETILLCTGKDREEVTRALRAADLFHPHATLIFAAIRFGATVVAGVATALYLLRGGGLHGMAELYPIGAAAAVFIGSKMALRSRVAKRTQRVAKELPFALDVILLMLESGVSLDQCFRHLAQWDANAIPATRRVLTVLVDDLQKGMSYEAALERWSDRMNVNGARELSALFRQTILHGTELAPALRSFVREFSEKRISSIREVIGKKTTQMTVVMILFLMPALMIVIAGPAVSSVFSGLRSIAR